MIHKPELRPFGMIPLINHDSSEVAVRSLEFTQIYDIYIYVYTHNYMI